MQYIFPALSYIFNALHGYGKALRHCCIDVDWTRQLCNISATLHNTAVKLHRCYVRVDNIPVVVYNTIGMQHSCHAQVAAVLVNVENTLQSLKHMNTNLDGIIQNREYAPRNDEQLL